MRTSEDKVCRKDLCWSVRAVYILEKLTDVSGPGLEEAGRYRSIPHNLGRDFLTRTFALNITRVISPDLIPRRMAYRACIQFLVLFATV